MSMLFKKKREREREMGKVNCLCMKFSHKVSNMSIGAKRLGATVVVD